MLYCIVKTVLLLQSAICMLIMSRIYINKCAVYAVSVDRNS